MRASGQRDKVISFSHTLMLPVTRACGAECSYCTFRQQDGSLQSFEQIEGLIHKAYNSGIVEVQITSGQSLNADSSFAPELRKLGYTGFIDYIRDICHLVIENKLLPSLDIGPLPFQELESIKPYISHTTLMLECLNQMVLDQHQKGKSLDLKIEHLTDAGLLRIPVNTGLLLGLGETLEDSIRGIDLVADLHGQYQHIQLFFLHFLYSDPHKARIGYEPEIVRKLWLHARKKMPSVPTIVPIYMDPGWKDAVRLGSTDVGAIFEGIDGVDWKNPYPRITEIQKELLQMGYDLKPRFPITLEAHNRCGVGEHLSAVLDEWITERGFEEYRVDK